MKVALISEQTDPARGGAETSTLQFARHLAQLGVEVTLYTRSPLPPGDRVRVQVVHAPIRPRALRVGSFGRHVDRLLATAGHDLVHAITPCMTADVYQPRGGAMPETVARNLAVRRGSARRMLKQLANLVNLRQRGLLRMERRLLERRPPPRVIAISDYVARQMQQHYALEPGRVQRILNGVDPPAADAQCRADDRRAVRRRYGIADTDVLVLLAAHNFKLKGVGPWIAALARLHNAGQRRFQSLIVGRGSSRPYRRLAGRLGVRGAVIFTGPVPGITPFLHAADVMVHPTYYDPCSRVVLEAMLSGLPCVTTRFNGAAEVIRNGIDGAVLDTPDDAASLAAGVRSAADGRFALALRERLPELVEALSMQRHAREVVAVYEQLIADKR